MFLDSAPDILPDRLSADLLSLLHHHSSMHHIITKCWVMCSLVRHKYKTLQSVIQHFYIYPDASFIHLIKFLNNILQF